MLGYHEINKIFWDFVHDFDANDVGILRKIVHTFSVAKNCYESACRYNFNEEDRLFCYLMGMFHDLGRFEQWTKYKTFEDCRTENHGVIGRRVLESRFTPESLELTPERFKLLGDTIQYHIMQYPGSDENTWTYLNIIHSSDAYDNIINTSIGGFKLSDYADGYTEEIFDKFMKGEKVYMYPSDTKLDRLFKSIGNAFCVSVDIMRSDIIEKNYFDVIYNQYVNDLNDADKEVFTKAINNLKTTYTLDSYRP